MGPTPRRAGRSWTAPSSQKRSTFRHDTVRHDTEFPNTVVPAPGRATHGVGRLMAATRRFQFLWNITMF